MLEHCWIQTCRMWENVNNIGILFQPWIYYIRSMISTQWLKYNMLNHIAPLWYFSYITRLILIKLGNLRLPLKSSITYGIDWAGLTHPWPLYFNPTAMAGAEATPPSPTADNTQTSSAPAEGYDQKCIFCKIVNNEMGTELLHCVRMLLQPVYVSACG